MRTKLLRGEDIAVLLVYPSSADEYRQALRTLGGCAPRAGESAPEPAGSRPVRAAYVATTAQQRHLWNLSDLAVSGRCAVVNEERALELLQEAARQPGAAAALFSYSPAGTAPKSLPGSSGESSIAAVRRVLTRSGVGVDRAVRSGLDAVDLPAAAREALSERLADALESGAGRAETEIARVELLLDLPWSACESQCFDRDHVSRVLDDTHAALDGVKERIVQFLASCPEARDLLTFEGPWCPGCAGTQARPPLVVRPKPAGERASALCLAGPSGTGKTSLARAVARALGRTCVSASLGGSRIYPLIRGTSRRPGCVVECLREAGVCNPVFILEDIDRLDDDDHDVDPVLGLLDASRRTDFRDEYLAAVVPDLSGVLWLATATDAKAIPERVRDRLTVIDLPSYTEREKLAIARHHLLKRPFACRPPAACGALAPDSPPASRVAAAAAPSQAAPTVVEDLALSSADDLEALWSRPPTAEDVVGAWRTAACRGRVRFEPDALRRIVREYTSEPGVAQLEARLAEVCRRVLSRRTVAPVVVTSAGVPALLGGGTSAETLPLAVRQAIAAERKRLSADSKGDSSLTNSWIEWLEHLPWNRRNDAPVDLARTREVLDAAQAGLDGAKELIIEYLAVRRRNPGGAGAVLCLLGPPGVGKTSLAQAVARALGRAFVKLPCGGLRDATDLRGHNRTWYKAQPGAILRELRRVGYRDPVFVLDEIDKIGPDPAAVLLEVLDPEQNGTFRDVFVELPLDLREVSFIATANDWHRIPPPLRDRLEVVELPGYTEAEKLAIARSHLVPAENRAAGLMPTPVEITDGALREIVRRCTREPGIRQFNRCIKAVCRKVALGRETGDPALDRRRVTVREVRRWLGAHAGADDGLDRLNRRLDSRGVPPAVVSKGRQVFERLSASGLASTDPEYARSRDYLECLAHLPWNLETVGGPTLKQVRAKLDEGHYGLAAAKEEILDHLAAHLARPEFPPPVLCLTGPEGVGKTSLAHRLAGALGRPCAHLECADLVHAAALVGDPRGRPGRIVEELRRVGTRNPVFVFDELDRLAGDRLSRTLLELFDGGRRAAFRDRYVDLPVDLSRGLFVATAVGLGPVASSLCERLHVVDLPGYSDDEKLAVAVRHVLPVLFDFHRWTPESVRITDEAVFAVIRRGAGEAGVWSLVNALGALCRKVARRRAEGDDSPVVIGPETVVDLLGPPPVPETRVRDRTGGPGVAVAPAVTADGGDVIFVEAARMPGRGRLILTGSLGDDMKESAQTAVSWLRAHATEYGVDPDFHRDTDVHLHAQALLRSKDGASAGLAMAAALVSLFTGRPVRRGLAVTGEITLSGHVVPVGGVRRKVLAARRRGLDAVVLPRGNENELDDRRAGGDAARGLEVHPVSRIDECLALALCPVGVDRGRRAASAEPLEAALAAGVSE